MIYFLTTEQTIFPEIEGITYIQDYKQVLDYFEDIEFIGVDTETEGFDPYTKDVLLLQLGTAKDQFVIDVTTIPIKYFKRLLESTNKTFLFQNAKFDLRFLLYHGIVVNRVYDTYLAESVLFTGIPTVRKALDVLVTKYVGESLDKSIRSKIHSEGNSLRVIKYAAQDVEYLEQIMNKQLIELKDKQLYKALELDNQFVKVLAYTEYCGLYLNKEKWMQKMEKDNLHLAEASKKLDAFIVNNNFIEFIDPQLTLFSSEKRCNINWASSKQVIPLMKKLGVNTKVTDKKSGDLKDSVEATVLQSQLDKSPFIPMYLEYKSAEKVVSTYGKNWLDQINPVTGRIHSSYNQILTTGRLSCGGKQAGVELVNLQNIPADKDTRSCFTNQFPDTTLIVCDYSGQESVVFANFTKEPKLLEFYKNGLGDMHSYIASKIFPELAECSLEEIKTKHKDKRQIAKAAGFAIQYGGQGITIANNLGISEERGDEIYNSYMNSFTELKKYFNKVQNEAILRGYILFNDISHRKSFIPNFEQFKALEAMLTPTFWSIYRAERDKNSEYFKATLKPIVREYFSTKGKIERGALNYPIQGSSAEITKLAGVLFYNYLVSKNLLFKVKIANFVHDEIIVESSVFSANEVAEKLQYSMEKAGDFFCKIIPLKAEPSITKVWSH